MAAASFPTPLRGPFAKFEGYGARLALILHEARLACGEATGANVDQPSVLGAAALIHYFKAHARRVYARLRATPEDKRVDELVRWITRQGGRVTARMLQHHEIAGVKSADEAKRLLRTLAGRGYGRVIEQARNSVTFELFG
jgi:hypothetical protein